MPAPWIPDDLDVPFEPTRPPDVLTVMQALEEAGLSYKLRSRLEDSKRVYTALVYHADWRYATGFLNRANASTPNGALVLAWYQARRFLRRRAAALDRVPVPQRPA